MGAGCFQLIKYYQITWLTNCNWPIISSDLLLDAFLTGIRPEMVLSELNEYREFCAWGELSPD